MTPQEQKQLEDFLIQLTHVGYVSRDPQAAEAIAAAFSRQPDAPYLTVQHCLLLSEALAEAQVRIAALEKSQAPAATHDEGSVAGRAHGWLANAAFRLSGWPRHANGFANLN